MTDEQLPVTQSAGGVARPASLNLPSVYGSCSMDGGGVRSVAALVPV